MTPQPYTVVIAASYLVDGTPLVTDIVNARVPAPTQVVHLNIDPNVDSPVPVRWSSPDGKNDFTFAGFGTMRGESEYQTSSDKAVAIIHHGRARGRAVIVADIGPPVNERATIVVRDEIGIGFGCYAFVADGPSVRIVDGVPERSSLADADVAVIGPGSVEGPPGPGYGCGGENYDPKATSYRLVFAKGGRLADTGGRTFARELPYEAVERTRPLDVEAADGRTYRLHIGPAAGTYFQGWIETLVDRDAARTDVGATVAGLARSRPHLRRRARTDARSMR